MTYKKLIITITFLVLSHQIFSNPVLTPGIWTEITPSQLKPDIVAGSLVTYDMAIDPNNPSTLYFNTNGTGNFSVLWKTTDGGSNWSNIGNFGGITKGVGFGRIKVDPKNSQHLYTCSEIGQAQGFWVSTDGGENWIKPQGYLDFCKNITNANYSDLYDLAVDPSDFNHVLISCRQPSSVVGESKDGGMTWAGHNVPGASPGDYNVTFLYSPSKGIGNNKTWLLTSPDGMWRTTDAGSNWTQLNTPYQAMYHMGSYYSSTGVLYIGGTPYPLRSIDNGTTWQQLTSGLGMFGTYFVIKGDGINLYTAKSRVWTFPNAGPAFVSPETDGITWTDYKPSGTSAQQLANGPIAMVYDSVNQIMYSSNIFGILALKNSGTTTTKAHSLHPQISAACKPTLICELGDSFLSGSRSYPQNHKVNLYNLKGEFVAQITTGFQKSLKLKNYHISNKVLIANMK